MKNRMACLFLGLVIAGFSLATVRADEAPKPPTETVKAGDVALSAESLRALLESMGYDTDKPEKNKDGKITGYCIKYDTGKYDANIFVLLSPDMSNLWFVVSLSKIEDPGTTPNKILFELLAANDKVYPSFFLYDPNNNWLYVKNFIPNHGIKAKDVSKRLTQIVTAMNNYDNAWNTSKWKTKN